MHPSWSLEKSTLHRAWVPGSLFFEEGGAVPWLLSALGTSAFVGISLLKKTNKQTTKKTKPGVVAQNLNLNTSKAEAGGSL